MTRTYALRKLLEHGPCTESELIAICGWPAQELRHVLMDLVFDDAITWANVGRGMRLWQLKG